jgi:hypothetical protein
MDFIGRRPNRRGDCEAGGFRQSQHRISPTDGNDIVIAARKSVSDGRNTVKHARYGFGKTLAALGATLVFSGFAASAASHPVAHVTTANDWPTGVVPANDWPTGVVTPDNDWPTH